MIIVLLVDPTVLAISPAPAVSMQSHYDAIIIPGGGLTVSGTPAPWVTERLDAAIKHDAETDWYLVLSRGTTHRPPPRDADDFPVDEAAASAAYLIQRGVNASRILLESWSLDTIGNAAFARLMHADLRGWRRVLVVTSAFHLPRTRVIFDWVFALPAASNAPHRRARRNLHPSDRTMLEYESVDDNGVAGEHLDTRRQKEQAAIRTLQEVTIPSISSLAELHSFLFVQHGAYRAHYGEAGAKRDKPHVALSQTY